MTGTIPFTLALTFLSQFGIGNATGRLLTIQGTPAGGVRVALIAATSDSPKPDATMISLAQTDSAGIYRLENVPAGRYFLVAGPVDSPSYYPGTGAPSEAESITVAGGATLQAPDFRFVQPGGLQTSRKTTAAGIVSGLVFSATNSPLQNATLLLSSDGQTGERFLTSTDRSGTFLISGVSPGEYTLTVQSATNSGYQSQGYERIRQSITLRENEGIDVAFRMRMALPARVIKGRPDLYVAVRELHEGPQISLSANFLTLESGEWLLDPRSARDRTGEVDVEVFFSNSRELVSARIVDPTVDPDLARRAVESMRSWWLDRAPVSERQWATLKTVVAVYPLRQTAP